MIDKVACWFGLGILWLIDRAVPDIGIEPVVGFYKAPTKKTRGSAGWDIYAIESFKVRPGEFRATRVGFRIELPENYEGQLRARSGMTHNNQVVVLGAPSTIDSDYRGEMLVGIINMSNNVYNVVRGHSIAQLVIKRVPIVTMTIRRIRSITERNRSGFGHTGK